MKRLKAFLCFKVAIPVWILLVVGVIGVGGTGVALWANQGKHAWLEVRKDADGNISGVLINPKKIPKDVLNRLPDPNSTRVLNEAEVRQLAEDYGFFVHHNINPQLFWNDGSAPGWNDITYWVNKKRPAWELELEFFTRQLVLEVAEREGIIIPYQGDLSKWAERVYPILAKKTLEKR